MLRVMTLGAYLPATFAASSSQSVPTALMAQEESRVHIRILPLTAEQFSVWISVAFDKPLRIPESPAARRIVQTQAAEECWRQFPRTLGLQAES